MHVGNGAVTPECAAISAVAALGGLAAFQVFAPQTRNNQSQTEKVSPLAVGAAVAGVFAAQMINLPISGVSSAHFVGGVWLSYAFGPRLGSLLMASVLALQAALLGDGGVAALGCNILNMALLPATCVWLVENRLTATSTTSRWATLATLSWLSVVVGAMLVTLETSIGRSGESLTAWPTFATKMFTVHCVAGLIEAAATLALVAAGEAALNGKLSPARLAIASLTVALVLAGLAPIVSSTLPDGYEFAAASGGAEWLLGEPSAATSLATVAGVQSAIVDGLVALARSESLIAVLATVASATVAVGVALIPSRRPAPTAA
jgi:cobalt/nickel transport system permease protein